MIMKHFFRTHRIAIFLAVIVGLITGLPTILTPVILGSAYHGIPFLPLSDEYHYLARIQDILDGHWSGGSTFLYEYKNLPSAVWPVNEALYAIPAFVFGIMPVVIASKFVLPAALFFLSYLFLLGVFKREDSSAQITAIAGALFIALGAEFVNYAYMSRVLTGGQIPIESLWTRLINPIVGAVQMTGFLIFLWKIWERGWRYSYIAAGIILASMIGYFFSFSLSLAILGTLFIFAFVRGERDIAKKFFLIGVISFVIDSPWWYTMIMSLGGTAGRLIATQNGMAFTHIPVLNKAVLVSTVLFALFFFYDRFYRNDLGNTRKWLFGLSLIVGCWIAFNQQVITGREVWYPHFVQYTVPLSVLALFIAGYMALHRHRLPWRVAMYALSAAILCYGLFSLTSVDNVYDLKYLAYIQPRAAFLMWFRDNAPKDCVVLVNANDPDHEEEERFIPAFSSCNSYVADDPVLSVTPERAEYDYLLRLQMMSMDTSHVRDYLMTQEGDVRGNFYADFAQAFGKGMDPWIIEKIDVLTEEYKDFVKTGLETHIMKYRADYILSQGPLSARLLRALPDLELVASTGSYDIYDFRKDMR